MKRLIKVIVVLIVLSSAAAIAYRISRPSQNSTAAPAVERVEAVQVAEVTSGTARQEIVVTGEISATATVSLAPKVGGRLVKVAVAEGDHVTKGQVVAELDKDAFACQVNQATAAVEVAKAGVTAATVAEESAEQEFHREEALSKLGVSPQAAYDLAAAAVKGAQARLEVAKATVLQAQAGLEAAGIQLNNTTLYAPFDAVVTARLLDEGALVVPAQPIVVLAAIDTVKVTAAVSERYLADICAGKTPATISVDCLPGKSFDATVNLVCPAIDPVTRTAGVEALVANADHALKPGMYARVTLVSREKPSVALIPPDALLGREGANYAYVLGEGRVKRVDVQTGIRASGAVEVVAGLSPGDRVVTSGEGNLFDGERVSAAESRTAIAAGGGDPRKNTSVDLTDSGDVTRSWEAHK